jgi:hypothetical protein
MDYVAKCMPTAIIYNDYIKLIICLHIQKKPSKIEPLPQFLKVINRIDFHPIKS